MLADYTITKITIQRTCVLAEDEDDALEKAHMLDFWETLSVETEITDIEPFKPGAYNVDD